MSVKKFLLLIFLLFFTPSILASHVEKSLSQITKKISSIKHDISQAQSKRFQLEHELEVSEMAASQLSLKLQNTNNQLAKQKKGLEGLQKQQQVLQTQLKQQQSLLTSEMKALYLLGRQPALKLLLNQNKLDTSDRMLTYYHYISRKHIQTISAINENLQKIKENQIAIDQHFHRLNQLRKTQQSDQFSLKTEKMNRYQLIKKINSTIKNKDQQLTALIDDKHHLEKILQNLEREKLYRTILAENFIHLRGKLSWPTKGEVQNYFGTKIDQSELRWNGILIKAPEGQPVYAIASGIVIFAKWMPGYGLLMIINHGHGYMTLYGRNHILYKKAGDIVHAGDPIATVGESGGYQTPALYFEIRHNAKPLNPRLWCQR